MPVCKGISLYFALRTSCMALNNFPVVYGFGKKAFTIPAAFVSLSFSVLYPRLLHALSLASRKRPVSGSSTKIYLLLMVLLINMLRMEVSLTAAT